MGERLIAQQAVGVLDQKSRRIEDDQYFRGQRLGDRFAGLKRDGKGNL